MPLRGHAAGQGQSVWKTYQQSSTLMWSKVPKFAARHKLNCHHPSRQPIEPRAGYVPFLSLGRGQDMEKPGPLGPQLPRRAPLISARAANISKMEMLSSFCHGEDNMLLHLIPPPEVCRVRQQLSEEPWGEPPCHDDGGRGRCSKESSRISLAIGASTSATIFAAGGDRRLAVAPRSWAVNCYWKVRSVSFPGTRADLLDIRLDGQGKGATPPPGQRDLLTARRSHTRPLPAASVHGNPPCGGGGGQGGRCVTQSMRNKRSSAGHL